MNLLSWFALGLILVAIASELVKFIYPPIAVYFTVTQTIGWGFALIPLAILMVIALGVSGALK